MPADGTRRSGRIPKQVAISLFGSDVEGRMFSEQTKTVVLSRYGAGIVSTYKLSAEQELIVRDESSHKEIEARVVGQIGSEGDTYIYGIAFLDRSANFWGIEFPDLSEMEKLASKTLLECASCHSREMADHSDLASDVLAVNESIVRYCQKCGLSTLWKQAAGDSAPPDTIDGAAKPSALADRFAPANPESARGVASKGRPSSFAGAAWTQTETPTETPAPTATLEPITADSAQVSAGGSLAGIRAEAEQAKASKPVGSGASGAASVSGSVKEQENRRKHARTRVNFKACVRRPGLADDVVACEDMSRGGLRFKSNRKYFEKMLIEVAVPYAPGDQAIFVPAQIAYVQELPEQNVYRCGVAYLRSSGR